MVPMAAPSPVSHYAASLTVAAVAALPYLGLLVYWVWNARRRDRTWRRVGGDLGLGGRGSAWSRPRLAGTYRGRALEAAHHAGYFRVAVRVANRARLFDEIRSSAPLPGALWLNAAAREKLFALRHGPGGARRRWWKVRVQGHAVTLLCLGTETSARHLRDLLDLACDLAEGVDSVSGLPLLPPEPPPAALSSLRF